MKILVSSLPKSNWWGRGTPAYENDWAMEEGIIPNQKIVEKEYEKILNNLRKFTEVEIIPFPPELDTDQQYKHDAVFVRDSFISNQQGKVVITHFSEKQRQAETDHVKEYLQSKDFDIYTLSQDSFMEGGEYYFSKNENILFSGVSRSNRKGVEETAQFLGVRVVFIVETDAFHMDTVFSIILDKKGDLCGLIACMKLIKNGAAIKQFAKRYNIPVIEIDPIDSIDFDGKGKISVNCLSLPGVLLGGHKFITPGVEEKIADLGINHSTTPITQFLYSAGGYHCLTNELI